MAYKWYVKVTYPRLLLLKWLYQGRKESEWSCICVLHRDFVSFYSLLIGSVLQHVLVRWLYQVRKVSGHVFVCYIWIWFLSTGSQLDFGSLPQHVFVRYLYQARKVSAHVFVCCGCWFCLFLRFVYGILELFQQCGIFFPLYFCK